MLFESPDKFVFRHIGPRPSDVEPMLEAVGASSLETLIDEAIPADIRLKTPLDLPLAESEYEYLTHLRQTGAKNKVYRSYIGLGYHDTITPSVILRNVVENPGWYTPYTPYQAEIAQGRLESLLNFQTMVSELSGMDVANASLLDEPTAAAEAMTLLHRSSKKKGANVFVVSDRVFPHTLDVLRSRAEPLGIELRLVDLTLSERSESKGDLELDEQVYGIYAQSPDDHGEVRDLRSLIVRAHAAGVLVAVGTDLLSLAICTPPGEMGADVVVGNSQRFGVPLGYGGPHAAFFATRNEFVRQAPGRLIGVSQDVHGQKAYRMALATREQHIRREKATSNICTAQALLANVAAMYGVFHGPGGLTRIAQRVHDIARVVAGQIADFGYAQTNGAYFDTLRIETPDVKTWETLRDAALGRGINFRYPSPGVVGLSINETVSREDAADIISVFAEAAGRTTGPKAVGDAGLLPPVLGAALKRTSAFMAHPVFNSHHSETEMMRYIRALERKDIGLDTSMIPLGSCTMKLNAASEMLPITWPEFSKLHPFVPADQAAGYHQIIGELERYLCAITGFAAASLQPNSGAQGEYAGLMVIQAWHRDRGETHRDVVLIPSSAHGTNPASAAMAGMRVVVVGTDSHGNIDVDDLKQKAAAHATDLSCLMVTYPSTHGVFEDAIREICRTVHEHGGQVYMDGANMNAQVGVTSPATIGADVCHINLHKTFSIPHGGGGPGMGPIAVGAHLAPYLPSHPIVAVGGAKGIAAVSGAPFGSASILLISYGYIRMLGRDGVTDATKYAILNANYLKARLEKHYPVLYARKNGRVAHEMIFDLRAFKAHGIEEGDVAKRLMDYGFHAPTVSFPVPGTLMVEPTESEPRQELDRFADALIAIRQEIQDVIDGKADKMDNVLKNAPHTAGHVSATEWTHPYTREQAAYPLPFLRQHGKFWPAVGRIDNPYGDRNLICSCPPMEAYA